MAKVYVGTFKKYNDGNLKGGWIDLAKCDSYEDFLSMCKNLHKDEKDPEFMIQDNEGFPDGLDCMEWLSEEEFADVKEAMRENEPKFSIVDYSEKAIALVGDTKEVKDQLKKMGGRFNPRLSCGAGWIFSKKQREALEQFVKSGSATSSKIKASDYNKDTQQFIDWLKESDDDYYKKNSVGAIKMHGGIYYIVKPHIENRFCFHDEGPDYELYRSLCADAKKMAAYFKSENLEDFDRKIARIEKGGDNGDKRVWWKVFDNGELYFHYYHRSGYQSVEEEGYKECTDEEKQLLLRGLKFGRDMFEKRLDTYLKRYGVCKLHTWTYWAYA